MENKRKKYTKPDVTKVEIDHNISIQMQSPPGDPFDTPKKPFIKDVSDKQVFDPFH